MTPFERIKKGSVPIPWWFWVGLIDLFLVLMTTLKPYDIEFPGKSFLVLHFNLATERKASVWFSGITLFVLAMRAFDLFLNSSDDRRNAWWLLSFAFAFLSLDEIGSLHERFGGWPDLLMLGGVPALMAALGIGILFRDSQTRRTAIFLLTGFMVLSSVAIQEHFEHLVNWPNWALGIRAGIEEGTELLGFFILLWGLIPQQKTTVRFLDLIPDPKKWTHFKLIIFLGLLFHISASLVASEEWVDSQRGNPLLYYQQIVLFFLFIASLRESNRSQVASKSAWLSLAVLLLLCSVGMNYNPPRILGIGKFVPIEHLEIALYLCLAFGCFVFCTFRPRRNLPNLIAILGMLILIVFYSFIPDFNMRLIISGLIVYISSIILMRHILHEETDIKYGIKLLKEA